MGYYVQAYRLREWAMRRGTISSMRAQTYCMLLIVINVCISDRLWMFVHFGEWFFFQIIFPVKVKPTNILEKRDKHNSTVIFKSHYILNSVRLSLLLKSSSRIACFFLSAVLGNKIWFLKTRQEENRSSVVVCCIMQSLSMGLRVCIQAISMYLLIAIAILQHNRKALLMVIPLLLSALCLISHSLIVLW